MQRISPLRNRFGIMALAALLGWLALPALSHAQFGGLGGGFGGGGFGGGGGFSGGGGLSGGGFSGGGFSGTNNLPSTQGFRPTPNYTTGTLTGGTRTTTGLGGGLGGGLGAGGGMLGGLGMMGGQALGGMSGLGGNLGRTQLGGAVVATRISGAALGNSLTPTLPAYPEMQARLERLLANATGVAGGRNIVAGLDATKQGMILVLRGTVRNEYEKQLAATFARMEPGVFDIRNELTVGTPAASPPVARASPGP